MMKPKMKRVRLDEPAEYEIRVQGRLRPDWEEAFGGMRLEVIRGSEDLMVTKLSGKVMDQAALHGILNRLRDLSLVLLLVRCVDLDEIIFKSEEEE